MFKLKIRTLEVRAISGEGVGVGGHLFCYYVGASKLIIRFWYVQRDRDAV